MFSDPLDVLNVFPASQGDLYMFRESSLRYGLKSIRYLGAKLWNALPVELRNAPSKVSFTTKPNVYLLNKVNQLVSAISIVAQFQLIYM